ncbi:hypothetical protein CAPTEDRAFT_219286 [Capitella teleta]|uniref:Negative elongation factor E n=1 Tax=Capitella teleta TaxID=283909 RepID=R7TQI7_CAPTE|nr:hypothetical protein CAPTEDRAFT_219286 [Capitella teleta]|eukprot:ELT95924.1 hypothetical protein CAPTEDRAFT_219286 [Capitella teleta]
MVYIHLPNHLTDEEEMLQKKFAKLRKKKKAVLALRAPKPEPKPEVVETKKRPAEAAADATAQAKKLLKLGVVVQIKYSNLVTRGMFFIQVLDRNVKVQTSFWFMDKQVRIEDLEQLQVQFKSREFGLLKAIKLGVDKKDQHSFKRTKRQKETEKAPVGFQPYSPVHTPEFEPEKPNPEGISRPRIKSLQESFISAARRESEGVGRPEYRKISLDAQRQWCDITCYVGPYERRERRAPKKGKTIYVKGPGLNEEILHSAFGSIGNIVNVSMEAERNNGFVTFETMEAAADAIKQMHECKVGNVQLHVSMAFNQPSFDPPPPTISSTSGGVSEVWGSMFFCLFAAKSKSKKAPESDQAGEGRDVVAYDVDMFDM